MKYIPLYVGLTICLACQAQKIPDFTIDADQVIGRNTEFWKAVGSDHLFYHVPKPSGQALLNRMEATGSNRWFRSHHTFTQDARHGVIRGQNVYSEDGKGNPVYDFSNVNRVFREYVRRGMKPIVEYDYIPDQLEIKGAPVSTGNDEGMIMRNTGPANWDKWSDLMKAATRNFIQEFGEEEVRTWYFEVWNEPDGWPMEEMEVFYKMYDVFVDAVTSVDPHLRVGGPACYHEYFLRPFLNHVVNGTNYVTGEKGTRIDFISYHIYGLSGKWLNPDPEIHPQVQRFTQALLWLQRLLRDFPELKGTEFHLNEWGLSSNYYRTVADYPDLSYRNTIESPLFLVKLVTSIYQIEDQYNFPVSMMLYWGFVWEADEDEFFVGKRELTTAGNIPKPMQNGFELMARLKENRLKVTRSNGDYALGVLATGSGKDRLAFITYNYEETERNPDLSDPVMLEIRGLRPGVGYRLVETSLDAGNNNTYAAWLEAGKPASSNGVDLSTIQAAGNLKPTGEDSIRADGKGVIRIEMSLDRHSMKLIELERE